VGVVCDGSSDDLVVYELGSVLFVFCESFFSEIEVAFLSHRFRSCESWL